MSDRGTISPSDYENLGTFEFDSIRRSDLQCVFFACLHEPAGCTLTADLSSDLSIAFATYSGYLVLDFRIRSKQ